MSRKRKTYSADFKAKVVLELLEGDETLNQVASKYEILPKSLQDWEKQFMENMSLAFDKSSVVKEYKTKINELEGDNDRLAKKLGKVVVERDWLSEKLKSLDLSTKKSMAIEKGPQAAEINKVPSLNRQLSLLSMSKTAHYYVPTEKYQREWEQELLNKIDEIYTEHQYYGHRRIWKQLLALNYSIGRKWVRSAMIHMGIMALYPKPKTSVARKEHKKYPYLLETYKNDNNQVVIERANHTWSADITYVRLDKGFAYLAAIIDWHTKKIMAWKLLNTMDVFLTTSVLNEALERYSKPEIMNTDQGSQYTAQEHIAILTQHGINISMDAKGRSIDNICIERFWRTIKYENIYVNDYKTLANAKQGIANYIETYNQRRLHSSIDYQVPDDVYDQSMNDICYEQLQVA